MRERGRGGVGERGVDHGLDFVGGENLERGVEGGVGESVGVLRQEQRPGDAIGPAIVDDGLGDGGDVVVVETRQEGRPAMTGGSEGDALRGNGRVRMQRIVGGNKARNVDEGVGCGELAGGVGHVRVSLGWV